MRTYFLLSLLSSSLFADSGGAPRIFGGGGLVDKALNPALSANAQVLQSAGTTAADKGLTLQEVEAMMSASVDSYFYSNLVFSLKGNGALGIKEAYASTLSLPWVTLKGGKFLVDFGKNNPIHAHAQPVIGRPIVAASLLGTEGLSSVGLQTSVLAPTPWTFDIKAALMRAEGALAFNSPNAEAVFGVARMEHLFDVGDSLSLGLGGSLAGGGNVFRKSNYLWGADLTVKYFLGKGRGDFAIAWVTEYILKQTDTGAAKVEDSGLYSSLVFRLSQKYWLGTRMDSFLSSGNVKTTAENLFVAYVPSESSALRLQGGLLQRTAASNGWQLLLQYNMAIGSHQGHGF